MVGDSHPTCAQQGGEPMSSVMDRNNNKIYDSLEQILAQTRPTDKVPVLVMARSQEDVSDLEKVAAPLEVKFRYKVVPAFAASVTPDQVELLARQENVEHIEFDAPVYAVMDGANRWFGADKARTDFGVTGDRDGAASYSRNDIVVAVIDTGIDGNHVDLASGKIIAWQDWVNSRTTPYDDHGHGTHVAGIVAGAGVANPAYKGVAPGAALVGLKVLNSAGSGSLSNVAAAVDWAVENKDPYNIRVISLSLGTNGSSDGTDTVSQAVNRAADAGIIPVIAAGNAGPGRYTVGSPGAAEKAITVAASQVRRIRFRWIT